MRPPLLLRSKAVRKVRVPKVLRLSDAQAALGLAGSPSSTTTEYGAPLRQRHPILIKD